MKSLLNRTNLFLILFVILALLLAACAAPAQAPAEEAAAPEAPAEKAAEPITLRFTVLPSEGEQKNVEVLAEGFKELYPNVEIQVEQLSGDYFQQLQLAAASETLPDVFWIHDQGTKQYAEKGLMLALDDYMAKTDYFNADDLYPSMKELGMYNGSQYMIPRDYNHLVTFYNATMFEEAGVPLPEDGWTWEEMVDAACALTIKNDDGTVVQYGIDGSNFQWWAMAVPAIRGFGGEVVDEDGNVVVNSPEAAAGIQALYDLAERGCATNYAENTSDTFQGGKTAMFFHVRPLVSGLWDAAQGNWDLNVATFPKFPVKGAVGTGTSGYAVSATTEHPDEAAALVLYIASPEGQKRFNSTGNLVPVLQSLRDDESWRSVPTPDINQDAFIKFPEWDTLPVEPRLPAEAAGEYETSRVELMEQVFLGKMTPEEMVAAWAERIQAAIDEAGQ